MSAQREKWIDNCKGIAILLVIIGHLSGDLQGISFSFVYGVHLVMFFLLSGFTLKKTDISCDYLNSKFQRLMTPYFYTCFAIVVADVINAKLLSHNGSIQNVTRVIGRDLVRSYFASGSVTSFGSIKIGTRIGAVWFFPALFFSILIFQWLLHVVDDSKKLGVAVTLVSLIGSITGKFIWLPFSLQSGMFAVFFLWIGYEIRQRELLKRISWHHYLIAQAVLLIGIRFSYCNISFVNADIADYMLSIPVGLSGCLLIYLISCRVDCKLLTHIGRNSLTILCVHLFAVEAIGWVFERILRPFGLKGNAYVVTIMAIHIVIPVIVATFIEKYKQFNQIRENRQDKGNGILGRSQQRDKAIDVARGIAIISMLIGHFAIDGLFSRIIYSFHMMLFVLISGYFYNSNRSFALNLKKMARSLLLPYFIGGGVLL